MKEIRRTIGYIQSGHVYFEIGSLPRGEIRFSIRDTELDINYLDRIKGKKVRIIIEEVEE